MFNHILLRDVTGTKILMTSEIFQEVRKELQGKPGGNIY